MNLMMLLEMASSTFGERGAVRCHERELSYAQLFRAAAGAARRFREADVRRVALLDVSSPAVPVCLFGAAWAGLPFAPLSYRLTNAEIERLVAEIAPAVLVTDAERAPALSRLDGIQVVLRDALLDAVPGDSGENTVEAWSMDPEAIAILLFTSGTTGTPKAAVIRHKHLVSYVLGSVEFASAADGDTGLMSVPPYHIAAMAAVCSSVYAGRRIVQLPNFSAEGWLALARRERVTHAFVVPTMLARIVDALEGRDAAELPELRSLSYGGGKMPLSVIERAMQLFSGSDFTNAYGLTETSSTLAVLTPDDHRAAARSGDPAVRRRLASVGRPLPSIELEIRDADGKALGPDQRGEIHVRGEQVSGEYLGRGSQLGTDGWFPTRDGGCLDGAGYLFLEGRIDDVIVRGGENLSPGEIEDVLLQHEAVADVAVVGVPSTQWGEAVAAAIVLQRGHQASPVDLQAWVRDRLRSSRVPETIVFRPELPYNETGKLLRRQVRAELEAES